MTITKEILKKEIDKLPNGMVEKVYKIIDNLKKPKARKKKKVTFKLGGQYDNVNIREIA